MDGVGKFTFNGKEYPARITMGAIRTFKRETGKDLLTSLDTLNAEDLGVLLYGAITSGCRAQKVQFDYTLDEFFDNVIPDEVAAWFRGVSGLSDSTTDEEGSKKKTPSE